MHPFTMYQLRRVGSRYEYTQSSAYLAQSDTLIARVLQHYDQTLLYGSRDKSYRLRSRVTSGTLWYLHHHVGSPI